MRTSIRIIANIRIIVNIMYLLYLVDIFPIWLNVY